MVSVIYCTYMIFPQGVHALNVQGSYEASTFEIMTSAPSTSILVAFSAFRAPDLSA